MKNNFLSDFRRNGLITVSAAVERIDVHFDSRSFVSNLLFPTWELLPLSLCPYRSEISL